MIVANNYLKFTFSKALLLAIIFHVAFLYYYQMSYDRDSSDEIPFKKITVRIGKKIGNSTRDFIQDSMIPTPPVRENKELIEEKKDKEKSEGKTEDKKVVKEEVKKKKIIDPKKKPKKKKNNAPNNAGGGAAPVANPGGNPAGSFMDGIGAFVGAIAMPVLIIFIVAIIILVVFFVVKNFKYRKRLQAEDDAIAAKNTAVPDLEDESVTADQLHSAGIELHVE